MTSKGLTCFNMSEQGLTGLKKTQHSLQGLTCLKIP